MSLVVVLKQRHRFKYFSLNQNGYSVENKIEIAINRENKNKFYWIILLFYVLVIYISYEVNNLFDTNEERI